MLSRRARLAKLPTRFRNKFRSIKKKIYWRLVSSPADEKRVVLIVGCQRSGTTLLNDVFERDFSAVTLSEESPLTGAKGNGLRLKPWDEVVAILGRYRAPLIVVKPLVESQNTLEMLENIPRSRAVWMFRHYKDVVRSNLDLFSQQISDLRALVTLQPDNWRSERVSPATREAGGRFYSDDMTREDAAALMWYARNILFFELGLDRNPLVLPCRYEDFVRQPEDTMKRIYTFLGRNYPGDQLVQEVHSSSIALGQSIELRAEVEQLCAGLQQRMETHSRRVELP